MTDAVTRAAATADPLPAAASADDTITLNEVPCPLCGAAASTPQLTTPDVLHGVPGVFTAARCDGCGHVFMNPQPAAASLAACYPDMYACHSDEVTPADAPPPEAGRAVRLMKWVPGLRPLYRWLADKRSEVIPPPGRVLELGCGRGDFLVRLQQAGCDAVGVDLVARSVDVCRARGLDVRHGTLAAQQFEAASFDAVCGWMVLEHTPDPRETIAEAARLLRPGGMLAFSVPDYAAWERRLFGRFWMGLELPRHLQQFTPATLRRLLSEEGLAVESVVHQRSAFYLVGSAGLALRSRPMTRRLGQRLIDFVDSPPMLGELALAPLAKLLGWIGQSGRLTVIARRDAEAAVARRDAKEAIARRDAEAAVARRDAEEAVARCDETPVPDPRRAG